MRSELEAKTIALTTSQSLCTPPPHHWPVSSICHVLHFKLSEHTVRKLSHANTEASVSTWWWGSISKGSMWAAPVREHGSAHWHDTSPRHPFQDGQGKWGHFQLDHLTDACWGEPLSCTERGRAPGKRRMSGHTALLGLRGAWGGLCSALLGERPPGELNNGSKQPQSSTGSQSSPQS